MNLKPFNLEKALAGAKVVTRGGLEVTNLVKFEVNEEKTIYCLAGLVDREIRLFTKNGFYADDKNKHHFDLFLVPEVFTGWVNVYKYSDGEGYLIGGTRPHKTKEDAIEFADSNAIQAQITFEIP